MKAEGSLSRSQQSAALPPSLYQINAVHTIPSYFYKIHFNIILPSTHKSIKWLLAFK
jgi:hypothetical protein